MSWDRVEEELNHQLKEWGVNFKTHGSFRTRLLKDARESWNRHGIYNNYEDLKMISFPKSPDEAVKYVLRHEIGDDASLSNIIIFDSLLNDYCTGPTYRPYFRLYERKPTDKSRQQRNNNTHHKSSNVVGYRISARFKGFKVESLDPFQRFKPEKVSKEASQYYSWFRQSRGCDLGILFEAWVACYALQHVSCFNCKYKKCLRWNGGSKASWQDMVCIQCKSTFEIKTKIGAQQVELNFEKNNIYGGSFRRYWALRNSMTKRAAESNFKQQSDQRHSPPMPPPKMFLVILPRISTFNRTGTQVYPVNIAEIDTVLPCVTRNSFFEERKIELATTVILKRHVAVAQRGNFECKMLWFYLPTSSVSDAYFLGTSGQDNLFELKKLMFVEQYSLKTYNRLVKHWEDIDKNQGDANDLDGASYVTNQDKQVASHDEKKENSSSVDTAKKDLEQLKLGNEELDDWEDLY